MDQDRLERRRRLAESGKAHTKMFARQAPVDEHNVLVEPGARPEFYANLLDDLMDECFMTPADVREALSAEDMTDALYKQDILNGLEHLANRKIKK